MTNTELLPCPFCGGHARPMRCQIGIEGTMGCNKWVTITCSMCEINNGGKGGFMRPRYDTEEEAAKAWNTRAQPIDKSAESVEEGKLILDPCCGSRMFYFDKKDQRVDFCDIRDESHVLCDGRELHIKPDYQTDFRNLPFPDNSYQVVVFDPPHLKNAGTNGWQGKKYGILS